jgi:hypothetical protein
LQWRLLQLVAIQPHFVTRVRNNALWNFNRDESLKGSVRFPILLRLSINKHWSNSVKTIPIFEVCGFGLKKVAHYAQVHFPLIHFSGFNAFTAANVFAMSQLSQSPSRSIDSIALEWVKSRYGENITLQQSLAKVLLQSHETLKKGLYIGSYSKWYVKALGLEPPPMLWIFEWDIVGGSSAALGAIYHVSKKQIDQAKKEADDAVSETIQMRKNLERSKQNVTKNKDEYLKIISSLRYQEQLFRTLGAYRKAFLNYYQWVENGSAGAYEEWRKSLFAFRYHVHEHQKKYGKHLDFPAYEFSEAEHGLAIMERAKWISRLAFAWVGIFMLRWILFLRTPDGRTLISGVFYPQDRSLEPSLRGLWRWTISWVLMALLLFSSFLAPVFTIWLFVLFLSYLISIRVLLNGNRISYAQRIWPLAFLSLCLFVMPLAFVSIRGPHSFWLSFWTSEQFRTVFFTLWVVLVGWIYVRLWMEFNVTQNGFQAFGKVLMVQGLQFLIGSGAVYFIGLEKCSLI